MKKIQYEKPQFIEGLTIRVAPDQVDRYLQVEEEIWMDDLAELPGFLGAETFVSEDNKGEVTTFYFWESEEAFKSVDPEFAAEHKRRNAEAMDSEFVRAWHAEDRRYRVREFRK